MRFLLDTHVLLWASGVRKRRSPDFQTVLGSPGVGRIFSAASIWEVAIKSSLRHRRRLAVNPHSLRRGLLERDYTELSVSSAHAAAVVHLPPIHQDPFDRLLIAQAQVEGITLLTADRVVASYPGSIRLL